VTDQQVFDYLSDNWTNGNSFTLGQIVAAEDLEEYFG
jgi:hypothetical protein